MKGPVEPVHRSVPETIQEVIELTGFLCFLFRSTPRLDITFVSHPFSSSKNLVKQGWVSPVSGFLNALASLKPSQVLSGYVLVSVVSSVIPVNNI